MTSKDTFYRDTFMDEFKKRNSSLSPSDEKLMAIAEHHLEDLTTIQGVYFDTDTLTSISLSSARQLAQQLDQGVEVSAAWTNVIQSFKKNYWGYTTHDEPQSAVRINIGRELFAYIWAMVQALMIMKVVIFYLGLKSAADAGPWDKLWVFAAISFSFGSLFFFAWRKTRRRK